MRLAPLVGIAATLAVAGCLEATEGRVGGLGGPDGGSPPGDSGGTVTLTVEAPQVSIGDGYACAVTPDHRLGCWGDNERGQLGDGTQQPRQARTVIREDLSWARVDASNSWQHTCGLTTDGALYCWGSNAYGQLGDGSDGGIDAVAPEPRRVGDARWAAVSAGAMHTCAIRSDRTLWCWGGNGAGQLGLDLGYVDKVGEPSQVGGDADWVQVQAAYGHTCGLRDGGRLFCWGEGRGGELGQPIDRFVDAPLAVPGDDWATVSAVHLHSCALKTDDSLWCWGQNSFGQLGVGSDAQKLPDPTRVADGGAAWLSVAAGAAGGTGSGQTCGVQGDGSLWCWGANSYGQAGLPTSGTKVMAPVQLGAATDWAVALTGDDHHCALKLDNTLWCWGRELAAGMGGGEVPLQISLE